jgi:hypothetical protein
MFFRFWLLCFLQRNIKNNIRKGSEGLASENETLKKLSRYRNGLFREFCQSIQNYCKSKAEAKVVFKKWNAFSVALC